MPDEALVACPHCGSKVKRLEKHIRKVHKPAKATIARKRVGSAKRRRTKVHGRGPSRKPFGPVFVQCEYCETVLAARRYADHVRRQHPGKPIKHRPALGERVAKKGLSDALRSALSKLPAPKYKQRYREWFREVDGGAPGLGRHR